jgi:hypothetical protein
MINRVWSLTRLSAFVALALAACDRESSKLPIHARLFEPKNHAYFGTVVQFDAHHDFHDGSEPTPAILIALANGKDRIWGSCETCEETFLVEPPGAPAN